MKKFFLPTSIVCLLTLLFVTTTALKAKSNKEGPSNKAVAAAPVKSGGDEAASAEAAAEMIYDSLHLSELGLPREVMSMAYKGQQKLDDQGKLNNDNVIAIADFSQSSKSKRLYIIDVKNYRVLVNTYVAHGKNSGLNYAERFSNTPESLQSSLGFYVTRGTYFGKHGLSLRLSGQEKGFNDNAEARAVVIHGANYVGDHRLSSAYMGRSFGCPAVPAELSDKVINLLKDGTCLFIYHPTQRYLQQSKLLNG